MSNIFQRLKNFIRTKMVEKFGNYVKNYPEKDELNKKAKEIGQLVGMVASFAITTAFNKGISMLQWKEILGYGTIGLLLVIAYKLKKYYKKHEFSDAQKVIECFLDGVAIAEKLKRAFEDKVKERIKSAKDEESVESENSQKEK